MEGKGVVKGKDGWWRRERTNESSEGNVRNCRILCILSDFVLSTFFLRFGLSTFTDGLSFVLHGGVCCCVSSLPRSLHMAAGKQQGRRER